jgi:LEA14-like dessication related protein
MRGILAALFATALSAFVGCSALGYKFETPRLSIVRLELLKGDLLQQNLRVRLHVQNPNHRELPVSGITYEIEVAGEKFAYGESERDFVVPALGEAEFDVGVTANAAGVLLKLAAGGMGRRDALDYRLFGRVNLKSGLRRSLPFEQRGKIDLR